MARRSGSIRDLMARLGITSYQARQRIGAEQGLSRSQASGHARRGEPSARELRAQPAWTVTTFARGTEGAGRVIHAQVNRVEAQRAGRYAHLVRQLQDGRIDDKDFRRRTSRMGPVAGQRLISDPATARAVAAQERADRNNGQGAGEPWFDSGAAAVRRARLSALGVDREPEADEPVDIGPNLTDLEHDEEPDE